MAGPVPPTPAVPPVDPASVVTAPPGFFNQENVPFLPNQAPQPVGGEWAPKDLAAALDTQFPKTVKAQHVQTQAQIADAPATIEEQFKAGNVTVGAGEFFHLRMPEGKIVTVPGSMLGDTLDAGGHLVSARDARDADLDKRLGHGAGSGVTAVVGGLSRGLTGGMSDYLGEKPGTQPTAAETEERQYLKEHRGILSGIGEAGGVVAQSLILPGGGLAGVAEEGAGTLAANVGLRGLPAKLAVQGVKAATEGAIIGHTEAVSENALGGGPLTMQKYAGSVGVNALLAGGLGVAGAGIGEGLGAAGRGLKKAGSKLIDNVVEKFGTKPTEESVRAYAEKTFGTAAQGVGDAVLHPQAASPIGAAARQTVRETAAGQGAQTVAKVAKTSQSAKDRILRAMMKDVQATENLADPKIQELLKQYKIAIGNANIAGDVVDAAVKADRKVGEVETKKVPRTQDEINQYIREKIAEAQKTKVFDPDVEKYIKNPNKVPESIKFKDVEVPSVAAEVSADEMANKLGVLDRFNKAEANYTAKIPTPQAYGEYVAKLINPAKDETHQAVSEYLAAAKQLATTTKDKDLLEAVKAAQSHFDEQTPKITLANQTDALLRDQSAPLTSQTLGDILAASKFGPARMMANAGIKAATTAVGHAVGGPIGAAMAFGMRTGKVLDHAAVEGVISNIDRKVGNAISDFFKKSAPATENSTFKQAAEAVGRVNRDRKVAEAETTAQAYDRRVTVIREVSNPDVLNARLEDHTRALATHHPKASTELGVTVARIVSYLNGQIPKTTKDQFTGKESRPSYAQMAAFNLKSEIAENPAKAILDLSKGRITKDEVDALKACYPDLYKDMVRRVMDALTTHVAAGKPLSSQQRQQLKTILEAPDDHRETKHSEATFGIASPETPQPAAAGGGGSGSGGPSARGKALATPADIMSEPGAE